MEPMLSVKQAATALGTSVSTLYRMADEGTVRRLTVRSRTVFERAEVERYIHVPRADAAAMPRGAGIGADGQAKRAVVLLSGGLDSATTLAFAKDQGFSCYAISFRYGQRNVIELEAARAVGEALGVRAHVEVEFDLRLFGGSALTATIEVPKHDSEGAPSSRSSAVTYVPARNTVFLSFALAWAETLQADDVFIGNALDFSDYPDCRPDYIHAFQEMANLATVRGVEGNVYSSTRRS
jgi:queuosine biosynthesis protein QueC